MTDIELSLREKEIINSLKIIITNSISDFKNLMFHEMDDKYFLQLTYESLKECLQTCEFVLIHSDKIRTKYAQLLLNNNGSFIDE